MCHVKGKFPQVQEGPRDRTDTANKTECLMGNTVAKLDSLSIAIHSLHSIYFTSADNYEVFHFILSSPYLGSALSSGGVLFYFRALEALSEDILNVHDESCLINIKGAF